MRKYCLSFLHFHKFNANQIQDIAMHCPDERLEALCNRFNALDQLQFTRDQMTMLAMVPNNNTIACVLEHYKSLFAALQPESFDFRGWQNTNQAVIKIVSHFTGPEADFIFRNVSQFSSPHYNFRELIDLLFTREGLQNFQVLLSNLGKILEVYALGFTPKDLLKIAEHSAQNLQTLFDNLEMVNRNETLTTEYFTVCLSTEGLSDLLLISIDEASGSNQKRLIANPTAGNEISKIVDDEVSDDVAIISTNTVSKKRKPSESQVSEADAVFSEPTTKRVATALRASSTHTVPSTAAPEVMVNSTSSNPRDSNLPNFGEGIMLLTMSDLENLAVDDQKNLYITKNGERIPVFPGHKFLGTAPSLMFDKMEFYIKNNECIGVISKESKTEVPYGNQFKKDVKNGRSIHFQMKKASDAMGKEMLSQQYSVARKVCETITIKVAGKRIRNKTNASSSRVIAHHTDPVRTTTDNVSERSANNQSIVPPVLSNNETLFSTRRQNQVMDSETSKLADVDLTMSDDAVTEPELPKNSTSKQLYVSDPDLEKSYNEDLGNMTDPVLEPRSYSQSLPNSVFSEETFFSTQMQNQVIDSETSELPNVDLTMSDEELTDQDDSDSDSDSDSELESDFDDLVYPNFGEGVKLLTRRDLKNIRVDDNNNFYFIKHGVEISVFQNHELQTFKRMYFYVRNNKCLGVLSKKPTTQYSSSSNYGVITGGGIYKRMRKARHTDNSGCREIYEEARQLCTSILDKVRLASKRDKPVHRKAARKSSSGNTSDGGFFSHENERAQANRTVETNQRKQP